MKSEGAQSCAKRGSARFARVHSWDALREVFDVLSDADAGGLRRDDFFNLHLCLSREGFFGSEKAGTLLASYPYAYAPPVWYRYFKSGFSGASGDNKASSLKDLTTPKRSRPICVSSAKG